MSPDISLNTKTPEGWTALVAAADKGHHGLVRSLLKHRATDVNVRDNQSKTISFFQYKTNWQSAFLKYTNLERLIREDIKDNYIGSLLS